MHFQQSPRWAHQTRVGHFSLIFIFRFSQKESNNPCRVFFFVASATEPQTINGRKSFSVNFFHHCFCCFSRCCFGQIYIKISSEPKQQSCSSCRANQPTLDGCRWWGKNESECKISTNNMNFSLPSWLQSSLGEMTARLEKLYKTIFDNIVRMRANERGAESTARVNNVSNSVEYQQIALMFSEVMETSLRWKFHSVNGRETPTQMIFNLTLTLAHDISLEVDKIDGWKLTTAARTRECESAAEKSYITQFLLLQELARTPHHRRRHRAVSQTRVNEAKNEEETCKKKENYSPNEREMETRKDLAALAMLRFWLSARFPYFFFAAALTFSRAWFHHRLARCGFYSSFICLQRARCRCGRYRYTIGSWR